MASCKAKRTAPHRHVNLTWLARALEDGRSVSLAILEVYGGQPPGQLAADLRALLNDTQRN